MRCRRDPVRAGAHDSEALAGCSIGEFCSHVCAVPGRGSCTDDPNRRIRQCANVAAYPQRERAVIAKHLHAVWPSGIPRDEELRSGSFGLDKY